MREMAARDVTTSYKQVGGSDISSECDKPSHQDNCQQSLVAVLVESVLPPIGQVSFDQEPAMLTQTVSCTHTQWDYSGRHPRKL